MKLQATHGYIAREACGCLVGLVVDDPDDPRWTAREVSKFTRRGDHIERATIEDCRVLWDAEAPRSTMTTRPVCPSGRAPAQHGDEQ